MAEFNQFGYGQPEGFEPIMWISMDGEGQTHGQALTNYDELIPMNQPDPGAWTTAGTSQHPTQINTTAIWATGDKAHVQQITEFEFGLEGADISPLEITSPPPVSRRASTVYAEIKDSIPEKVERRREQNRASQRAYRDRKEKHQQELEQQIAVWKDKHRELSESLTAQTAEVSRLRAKIEDLNSQILSLQAARGKWTQGCDSPSEFDLVPFGDKRPESWDESGSTPGRQRDASEQS